MSNFQTITSNGKCDDEIVKRIEIARKKKLYKHMCGRHFYTDVKHGQ